MQVQDRVYSSLMTICQPSATRPIRSIIRSRPESGPFVQGQDSTLSSEPPFLFQKES